MNTSNKLHTLGSILIVALLVACACGAATLSRTHTGFFKPEQVRILNNVITEAEANITTNETALALVFPVVVDTNVTTTVTAYTPAGVGQILVGGAGTGTNASWAAFGLTTNDWTKVGSNP